MLSADIFHRVPLRESLVVRSLVAIFLLLTLILGSALFVSIHLERKEAMEELHRQVRHVSNIMAQAIGLPVWNLDTVQVHKHLAALGNTPYFCGARVVDSQEKELATLHFPDSFSPHQWLETTPIYFENPTKEEASQEQIGALSLCVDNTYLDEDLRQTFLFQAIACLLISLFLLMAFYAVMLGIMNPLNRLRHAVINLVHTMQPIDDEALLKPNEIGGLAHSFNATVSDLVRANRQLSIAKEKAEKSNRTKSDFLANMTHELRTPLNSIIGLSNLLADKLTTPEQKNMLDTVRQASGLLLDIVNDILDLSKIEAGEVTLEQVAFDFVPCIERTVNMLRYHAEIKGIALKIEVQQEPPPLLGDPMRIGQILTNLINNAIKFTHQGGVTVEVSHRPLDHSRVELFLQVHDTGIGIAEDKLESVFQKFMQAHVPTENQYGGSGLGLAIVRHLVTMMGGETGVQSDLGKGSTFWCKIPFTVCLSTHHDLLIPGERDRICGVIPPDKAKLLVVEDHPLNQAFVRQLLKKYELHHYDLVETGPQALDAVGKKSYDLVLMDCFIPDLNGYETTKLIRQTEQGTDRHLPIIAMTANAMIGEEEKCLAAGMDDYIAKPVVERDFIAVLSQWIRFEDKKTSAEQAMPPTSPPAHRDPVVDLSILRSFTGGDAEMEKMMIDIFITQSHKHVASLKAACVDGISQEWVEMAHALKGGAGGIGAQKLKNLCADAQMMEQASAEERMRMAEQISAAYADVLKYLR